METFQFDPSQPISEKLSRVIRSARIHSLSESHNMTARAPPLAKKVLKLPLALPAGDALSVLGVHLQNFPVYYAYKNFHRPGGAGAPTAPPGYAADS